MAPFVAPNGALRPFASSIPDRHAKAANRVSGRSRFSPNITLVPAASSRPNLTPYPSQVVVNLVVNRSRHLTQNSEKSFVLLIVFWWAGAELNCRHEDFQSSALPTELPAHPDELPLHQLHRKLCGL
jgi:hypothetical protein